MDEDPGEEFSGGDTTTFDSTRDAFNIAGSNILAERRIDFFEPGNSVFDSTWVEAPASTSGIDGLGPVFNQRACVSCHQRDGRGRPPTSSESQMLSMLIRLSVSGSDPVTGGPVGVTNYGGQLNDKGIASGGVSAEGSSTVSYTEIPGTFPDGEIYSLRRPAYNFTWNFGTPASFLFSPRTAPMIPGLGLLEAIRETTIKSFEDPNDRDGDGISGRMNLVYDFATGTMKTGRFGWKANQPNLRQQAQAAFLGDIGITSPLFIAQNCEPVQTSCL
ncbi:MAG: thiol oxidoreductase, partial [Leptospira sp.]|nr:thiol oxidoreductase [Leptospira sp.]